MRSKGWVHVLIWLVVIATALILPVLQMVEDRRVARAIAVVQAAEQQQQANNQFAADANRSLSRAVSRGRGVIPTTQDFIDAIPWLGPGITLAPKPDFPVPIEGLPANAQMYRLTRADPPAQTWLELGRRFGRVTPFPVAIPQRPVATSYAAIGDLLRRWCEFIWVMLYFAFMLRPRMPRVILAQVLLGLAVWNVISSLSESYGGFWIWMNRQGSMIWLLMLLGSTVMLIHVIRLERRKDLRHCLKCRYDLWSNTSGICPECGAELTAAQRLYVYAAADDWKGPAEKASR